MKNKENKWEEKENTKPRKNNKKLKEDGKWSTMKEIKKNLKKEQGKIIEKENKVFIYTLSDPRNDCVKYIGKTKNRLNYRLTQHYSDSKKYKTYKTNWINKLFENNLKPKIELLDIVSENDWQFWEMYWISQFRTWGFELVNSTDGGDGNSNVIVSIETRNKLSSLSKNKKSVIQYDLEGNFLNKYKSIKEASRITGVDKRHITRVCHRRRYNAGGFIWCFENDKPFVRKRANKENGKIYVYKPILQLTMNGEFIKYWEGVNIAKAKYGSSIQGALSGKYKHSKGYIWIYSNYCIIN